MKAAVFVKPYLVETIEKDRPNIGSPKDAIVKVKYSGLCGSDLHYYRGLIPTAVNNTMGHEFVGTISELGSDVSDFKVGDEVIATFTTQCGSCWYCKNGYSGTCDKTNTFGKPGLEGAQAEYVLVPYASSTLIRKPLSTDGIPDSIYVLMADIFVTGYFGVKKILDHYKGQASPEALNVLQIGAGPVGLCAVRILKYFGFKNVVVVDGIEDRLNQAKRLGAHATSNYTLDDNGLKSITDELTEGRGYDAVLEVVGATSALKNAFDNVRRGGFISSVGMGHDAYPFNTLEAYVKCITISHGRCNSWSLFGEALEIFEQVKQDFVDFIEVTCPIDDAKEYYEKFEKSEVKKVVFTFQD